MKRLSSCIALGLVGACSPGGTTAPARVEVADAICRPAAPGRDATGCYVTLTASRTDRLVSVTSPDARAVQVHEMKTEGDMMQMAELPDGVALPAGEAVRLRPGGMHLMFLGATRLLDAGGRLPMTLTFEHAPARQVEFVLAQPAAAGHGGH